MANIKNDPAYDPFPREGLVRQFKPAILAELGKFLKKYPLVDRQDALFTFVNLACDAEKRFDPARGFSFWTYCQHYLKGAIRILITKVIAADKLLIHEPIVPYDDWKRSTLEAEGNGNEEFVPRSQQFGSPAEEKAALLIQKEMRAREV